MLGERHTEPNVASMVDHMLRCLAVSLAYMIISFASPSLSQCRLQGLLRIPISRLGNAYDACIVAKECIPDDWILHFSFRIRKA